jgi:cyclopropane fatty-acyl-phospholipid synthase-like methyltransferase
MSDRTSQASDLGQHGSYPLSNKYDGRWVIEGQMGPNPLWLLESLTQKLSLRPNLRVLDLGCGKALTSIFLAKEFGVRVWASDLWNDPHDNLKRIRAAGVEDLVCPVRAEAHDLPFAHGFFDLIVSVDAYHYFGTDDLYLGYITKFLSDGGQIGIVSPALREEGDGSAPEHLRPFWEWEFCAFHSADWWRRHWSKSGRVTVETAEFSKDGWRDWLRWFELVEPTLEEGWMKTNYQKEVQMLRADAGKCLGFVRLVGREAYRQK